MHFTLVSLLSVAVAAIGVRAQLTVNTPASVVLCQPLLVTWSGGTPPYILSVHDGSDPSGTQQIIWPPTTALSQSWIVNVSDATIGFNIRDNTGLVQQSGAAPVQSDGDTSCLSTSPTTGGSTGTTSGSSTTTPGGSSTTGASTTGSTGTSSHSTSSGSSTTSSSSPSTTSTTSSALSAHAAELGITGIVGAALALLLA